MQNSCKKEVPENSVVAVEAAVAVVVTVFLVVVVAAVVVAVVVGAFVRDNGTIVFKRNYPNKEEEEPRLFTTRIVT